MSEATKIIELATIAYKSMETKERANGSSYVIFKDDAPAWCKSNSDSRDSLAYVVHARGVIMPDDWRYKLLCMVLYEISSVDLEDLDGDDVDALCEYLNNIWPEHVSIWNGELCDWLGSHSWRVAYVNRAIEEGMAGNDILNMIQAGQLREIEEIAQEVINFLSQEDL